MTRSWDDGIIDRLGDAAMRLQMQNDRLREVLKTIISRVDFDPDVRGYELAEIAKAGLSQ